jgi:prophage tail gpP-like protein
VTTRPRDWLSIESNAGRFDRFTCAEITNDICAPAEASFECGDDDTWRTLDERVAPGTQFRVYVNQKLRLTGRVQVNDVVIDSNGGATCRFVIRTRFADAMYASAKANISVLNATIRDIVIRAYEPLGFQWSQNPNESDFVFKADLARDLMTGRTSRGGSPILFLEAMTFEQAKVNPPETIYEFVERHLLRFHLTHWDSPDGKIVVGAPNDQQRALYKFRMRRGPLARTNNILSARWTRDIADTPTSITVYNTVGPLIARYRLAATATPAARDINPQHFYRPVLMPETSAGSRDQLFAKATRELADRSKKVDAWEITTDGWSFWDGQSLIPYGIDTVADIDCDVVGGTSAPYLVHRTQLRLDPDSGFVSTLSLLRQGIWDRPTFLPKTPAG